jgi:hypothetical protein
MPPRNMFNSGAEGVDEGNGGRSGSAHDLENRLIRLETQFQLWHLELSTALNRIDDKLEKKFVTQAEFWPVRVIVFAGAGTIMLAVLGAMVALVVRSGAVRP